MQQPISLFHSTILSSIAATPISYIYQSRLARCDCFVPKLLWIPVLKLLGNSVAHEIGNQDLYENSVGNEIAFKSCTALQNNHSLSWIQATDFTNIYLGLNPIKPHKQKFFIITTKAPKGYHKLQMPVKSKQCLNLCKGTSLVIMSAGLSTIPIF